MDQSIIQDLHCKKGLPMELIQIILRYTWEPQPQVLLDDIKSFTENLPIILKAYYIFQKQLFLFLKKIKVFVYTLGLN